MLTRIHSGRLLTNPRHSRCNRAHVTHEPSLKIIYSVNARLLVRVFSRRIYLRPCSRRISTGIYGILSKLPGILGTGKGMRTFRRNRQVKQPVLALLLDSLASDFEVFVYGFLACFGFGGESKALEREVVGGIPKDGGGGEGPGMSVWWCVMGRIRQNQGP